MQIHIQRKLMLDFEQGSREMREFDPSVFPMSDDVQINMIPDDEGVWLTIIQDTPQDLDEVMILPGFHRVGPGFSEGPQDIN
jgi:hypothetical protein